MKNPILAAAIVLLLTALSTVQADPVEHTVDVCIYTATPSGILTAIAAKREGKTVLIVEPGRWVGGMLGAGLKPLDDCPNINATGGMTRALLDTLEVGAQPLNDRNRRSYNPGDIRKKFEQLIQDHGLAVHYDHRIGKTEKDGAAIVTASFDFAPFDDTGCPPAKAIRNDQLRVSAKIFIDASYEGDLMATAGVSYRTGREALDEYGEEAAGVQPPLSPYPIDPFVVPGDRDSDLLPMVEDNHGEPGDGDHYTQAYNYRYYTTSDPQHRVPFGIDDDYDPAQYELVGRYIEHIATTHSANPAMVRKHLVGIFPGWMNAGEWNYQRETLFSMSPLGISQRYAAGDQAEKAAVWKEHQRYLQGLHRFMSTDERVPADYREEVAALGLDRRAHPDTQGWPHQLYIRVARRLKAAYTITAHDVYNRTHPKDPVALAQYGIDTYPSRRIWLEKDGQPHVSIEGNMFVGGAKGPTNVPYPIPYDAIVPVEEEATNLIVPVCFSATHLGYASARMEPVFMMCGESAGIAASHAIDEGVGVQRIDRDRFQQALLAAGQKLSWDPEKDKAEAPASRRNEGRSTGDPFSFSSLLGGADRDGDKLVSQKEWADGKPDWAWIFPFIDQNRDGQIDEAEYTAFQKHKATHSDWVEQARASLHP
ncbi:MAG TPA: FAD-dependent oxidoreductase [Bacteroidia bacterium]|nr:FAD-dependent oxidoreductase [Bacteroidia bacterium]